MAQGQQKQADVNRQVRMKAQQRRCSHDPVVPRPDLEAHVVADASMVHTDGRYAGDKSAAALNTTDQLASGRKHADTNTSHALTLPASNGARHHRGAHAVPDR
jgi:hypothetical protein